MTIESVYPDTPKPLMARIGDQADSPTVKKARDRYTSAKQYRKQFDQDWPTWIKYYLGHHFDQPKAPWRSKFPYNYIFSTIETTLPILTDSNPELTVVPIEPTDSQIADILGQIVKKIWVDQKMPLKLPDILKNTLIYGTGFAKVWWDSTLKDGRGDVAISVVDPRHLFPSPGATSFEDAEYVLFAANVPLCNLYKTFPETKAMVESGLLKPGIWDEQLTSTNPYASTYKASDVNSVNTTIMGTGDAAATSHSFQYIPRVDGSMKSEELVTLVEMWDRNDDGYPQCTVIANGVIVKPTMRPYAHDRFPFIRFIDYPVGSQFWAMGEVQQLRPIQDAINDRRSQIHDILRLTANPPLIADLDSGVNPKALTNRPASIIFKNRGSEVRWEQPPQIPSALFEVQQMDKADFDAISGIHDVTQGRRPVGVEAASAIVELQEAAQTRIRYKVRNEEFALQEMGYQIVALVQQFYDDNRTIRLVGKNSAKPVFVSVNVPTASPTGGIEKLNDLSVGEYDVEIGVGSTLPINKGRLFGQYLQMYRDQIVDRRAVLENAPAISPNQVEAILQRMELKEQQMIAMQMGMAGPADQAGTAVAEAGAIENEQASLPTEDELRQLEEEAAGGPEEGTV